MLESFSQKVQNAIEWSLPITTDYMKLKGRIGVVGIRK